MADPTNPPVTASAALLAFLVASTGPVLGPWLVIVAGGFGGSMVSLLSRTTPPRMGVGFRHLARGTLLAMIVTAPAAWAISEWGSIPMAEALGFVAAVIGLKADLVLRRLGDSIPFLADKPGKGQGGAE